MVLVKIKIYTTLLVSFYINIITEGLSHDIVTRSEIYSEARCYVDFMKNEKDNSVPFVLF